MYASQEAYTARILLCMDAVNKTVRVSTETHARIQAHMEKVGARSADEALADLLSTNLSFRLTPKTIKLWSGYAEQMGFSLQQWVFMIVGAYVAYGETPGRIESTLKKVLKRMGSEDV